MEHVLSIGTVLQGRYRIMEVIGEGATGTVYVAEDLAIPRARWAIKEMNESIHDEQEKLDAVNMFRRECDILKNLNHPGLPKIIDSFSSERGHFLVMEFIEGESLLKKFKERNGVFTTQEILPWVFQILDILEYLHSQSPPVVFRDLKPSNIMITAGGRAKLIDFGIARHFTPGKVCDTYIMGTPGFSAPEQYGGRQTDPRSDIYSLAATMYFLLSGEDPESFNFKFPPVSQYNPNVQPWLSQILAKALEVDPEKRIQSVSLMKSQLKRGQDVAGVLQASAPVVAAVGSTNWYQSFVLFNSPWKTLGLCLLLIMGSCIPFIGWLPGCVGFLGLILLMVVSLVASTHFLIKKDYSTAITAFLIMLVGVFIISIPTGVINTDFLRTKELRQLTSCKSNLKHIATALEIYSTDNSGNYPESLPAITPNYLRVIPTCARAGIDTYSNSYKVRTNPDVYTIFCQGSYHTNITTQQNYPQYDAIQGLIEP